MQRWLALLPIFLGASVSIVLGWASQNRRPEPVLLQHFGTQLDPDPRWRFGARVALTAVVLTFCLAVAARTANKIAEDHKVAHLFQQGYSENDARLVVGVATFDVLILMLPLSLFVILLAVGAWRRRQALDAGIEGIADPNAANWKR